MNIDLWRQRKKELDLTLDDIAKLSGVSRGTVARIFSKNNDYDNPERVTIEAIERALGLAPTEDEESAGWQKTKKSSLTPEEDEWLDLYFKLSSHGRACVETVTALINNYLNALDLK